MKAVFFTVFALAASAIASPVIAERQLESQGAQLDTLFEQIQGFTANINKTTAAAPENPNLLEQNAAAAALAPDFDGITKALTSATTLLSKREFWLEARTGGGGGGGDKGCSSDCLLWKIKTIVWEIAFTLKIVIIKLGLGCVLIYLTPLIVALSGLIRSLDKVVDGLLLAVKLILDDVLKGLAGGLLGLI